MNPLETFLQDAERELVEILSRAKSESRDYDSEGTHDGKFMLSALMIFTRSKLRTAYQAGANEAVDTIKRNSKMIGAVASKDGDVVYEVTTTIFNKARSLGSSNQQPYEQS